MLLVVLQSFRVSFLLVQHEVFPPSMHYVLDRILVHDHHTLLWLDHSMFWRSLVSHHTLLVNVNFTPPAIRKSEGGPPCCSMPLGARSGVLLVGAV